MTYTKLKRRLGERQATRRDCRPLSLVPGLIPHGVVTLLLGNKKVGKSALALELAVAVAQREKQWVGFPVDPGKGYAVYLLGEDFDRRDVNSCKADDRRRNASASLAHATL